MLSKKLAIFCIFLGLLGRLYGINSEWGSKDHYNRGGPMTHNLLLCLKSTPFSESMGLAHFGCKEEWDLRYNPLFSELTLDQKQKAIELSQKNIAEKVFDPKKFEYSVNHPPTYIYFTWIWVHLFGEHEWVYRFAILIFSFANIFLVYKIARRVWPHTDGALWTAAFQSLFLGGMYFGSHPDYPNEFNATFILLAVLLALDKKVILSFLAAIGSGFLDWPGYFAMIPLAVYFYFEEDPQEKKVRWKIFASILLAGLVFVTTAMWLRGFQNPFDFLAHKLVSSGHIPEPTTLKQKFILALNFVVTFFRSHSRLMSPLLAGIAFFHFFTSDLKKIFTPKIFSDGHGNGFGKNWWRGLTPFHKILFLVGTPALITDLVGYQYVIVHIFWFMLGLPFFSFVLADFTAHKLQPAFIETAQERKYSYLVLFVLMMLAVYPYGVYQSSRAHDVLNSSLFILSAFGFLWAYKKWKSELILMWFFVAVGIANVSQTINYRNEVVSEKQFCKEALLEYLQSESSVNNTVKRVGSNSETRMHLYCRGIPIEYAANDASTH